MPDPLGEIQKGVDKANKTLGDPAGAVKDIVGTLGGVASSLDKLESDGIFQIVKSAVKKALQEVVVDNKLIEELLKKTAEQTGRLSNVLIKAIATPFESPGSDPLSRQVAEALEELIKAIGAPLINGFGNNVSEQLKAFPSALTSGPLNALIAAQELKPFLKTIGEFENVRSRLKAVRASLASLFSIASPNSGQSIIVGAMLKDCVTTLGRILGEVDSAGKPTDVPPVLETAQQELVRIISSIVFPTEAILNVIKAARNGKLWSWLDSPTGLQPGGMHKWLNDATTYEDASDIAFARLQRTYRAAMIAALDSYSNTGGVTHLTSTRFSSTDGAVTTNLVAGLVTVFLDNTISFVFQPECRPLLDSELMHFEDIGLRFADVLSKQSRLMVRTLLGTLLRGIWEFSAQNEVLIELIATSISTSFAAILRGVCANLTWSLQVTGRYRDDTLGSRSVLLDPFDSMEQVESTGQKLQYVAFSRLSGGISIPPEYRITGSLAALAKDFAAYLDVCYLQFKIGSAFPPVSQDVITIARAEVNSGVLLVEANSSEQANPNSAPRPILRVYYCCDVWTMTPPPSSYDAYRLEVKIAVSPCAKQKVLVLSNRGGSCARDI